MATDRELATYDSVTDWLKLEHEYQFAQNHVAQEPNPGNSRTRLLWYEFPNRWTKFQQFHNQFKFDEMSDLDKGKIDQKLVLQLGQSILKIAGAAHSVFIWDALSRRMSLEKASQISWKNLEMYRDFVADESNSKFTFPSAEHLQPGKRIDELICELTGREDAFDNHSNALMVTCAGLAVASLVEIDSSEKAKLVLPAPGYTSDHLEIWNYKPQKTAS